MWGSLTLGGVPEISFSSLSFGLSVPRTKRREASTLILCLNFYIILFTHSFVNCLQSILLYRLISKITICLENGDLKVSFI